MNGIGGIVPLSTLVSCIASMVCFAFLIKSETPLAELCSHSCKVSRCTPNHVDKEATVNAIINGKNVNDDEFQSAILMAKIKTAEINAMESENPPAVDPQEEIHEPEDGAENDEAAKAKKEEETFNNIMERMNLK